MFSVTVCGLAWPCPHQAPSQSPGTVSAPQHLLGLRTLAAINLLSGHFCRWGFKMIQFLPAGSSREIQKAHSLSANAVLQSLKYLLSAFAKW